MNVWNKFKNWIVVFFIDEYELTIYFPDQVVVQPDGSKKMGFNPKTYTVRKLNKITNSHFKFVTVDKNSVEIKTVDPVGYDIIKTK